MSDRLVELDEGITAMRHSGVYRPRWAVGMSNAELEALAKHEGKNPHSPDWFDAIDSEVIRMGKTGYFRQPGADTITGLQRQQRNVRAELWETERQLKEVQEAQQRITRVASGGQPPPRVEGAPLGSNMGAPPPSRPTLGWPMTWSYQPMSNLKSASCGSGKVLVTWQAWRWSSLSVTASSYSISPG